MPDAIARRRDGYEHEIEIREHRLIADEPQDKGGTDAGPSPTELLAAALASCTAITIEMYADRKEWELGQVEVSVDAEKAADGKTPRFLVDIRIPESLSDEQRQKVEVIASKCPVHRALASDGVEVADTLTAG
jgi:putative redox protein